MGQIRVKALPFLSNNIASTLLCSVFSFIALEAEIHSRCALQELPQGHSQVEVLWMTLGDLKVSYNREAPLPAVLVELELSLQINSNFSFC